MGLLGALGDRANRLFSDILVAHLSKTTATIQESISLKEWCRSDTDICLQRIFRDFTLCMVPCQDQIRYIRRPVEVSSHGSLASQIPSLAVTNVVSVYSCPQLACVHQAANHQLDADLNLCCPCRSGLKVDSMHVSKHVVFAKSPALRHTLEFVVWPFICVQQLLAKTEHST